VGLYSSAMQSGKSTVAAMLEDHGYERLRFAEGLKAMSDALLRVAGFGDNARRQMLEGSLKEEPIPILGNKTPRYIMQRVGSELGRDLIDENLWANLTLAEAERTRALGLPVVIDDMRFPNEAQAIRNAGGVLVHVDRGLTSDGTHASEGALDAWMFDHYIVNKGTLADLRNEVHFLAHGIAA
jgi:hypothetical protein